MMSYYYGRETFERIAKQAAALAHGGFIEWHLECQVYPDEKMKVNLVTHFVDANGDSGTKVIPLPFDSSVYPVRRLPAKPPEKAEKDGEKEEGKTEPVVLPRSPVPEAAVFTTHHDE